MGCFKLALFFVGFLGLLLGGNSMENTNLIEFLNGLRENYPVIKNNRYVDGYPLATSQDISEIENHLGYSLPESLKEFYRVAGNLRLENFRPAVPNGGNKSELYNLIKNSQKRMNLDNKLKWIPFCAVSGSEFFCIHREKGVIQRYVVPDGFEKDEFYQDIIDWIRKKLLI